MSQVGTLHDPPRRAADLAILLEIGEALNSSVELDEILNMILTGATAGQGLRFNRAFLLLLDERDRALRGSLAIGPDDSIEAARIWSELERKGLSLADMLRTYGKNGAALRGRVGEIASRLCASSEDASNVLIRALTQNAASVIHRGAEGASGDRIAELLGVDQFAVVPIHARSGPVGVLLADNAVTCRPIEPNALDVLRLLANHAGTAIEKARLYARIREEKEALERAHDDLRRNQQTIIGLQRLSDLGEMAARVAHEIRNPLVSIGGFARRMLADTPASDRRRKPLQVIVEESERLETILQEVLDYARPLTLRAVPLDVPDLVAGTLEMVAPEAESLGIELIADLESAPHRIIADAGLLRVALLNLLRNSLQALAGDGGRGGRVEVRARRNGSIVEISVRDDGPGIPADVGEHILEPFFTTKPAGSGLGLPIVAQVMKVHGGRVRFASDAKMGATFYLDLPIEKKEEGGDA